MVILAHGHDHSPPLWPVPNVSESLISEIRGQHFFLILREAWVTYALGDTWTLSPFVCVSMAGL